MFQSAAFPPAQETPTAGENQVFAWRWGSPSSRFSCSGSKSSNSCEASGRSICLLVSGLTMTDESSVQLVKINGVNLPLRFCRFRQEQVPLHIEYCYWDGRSDYDNDELACAPLAKENGKLVHECSSLQSGESRTMRKGVML